MQPLLSTVFYFSVSIQIVLAQQAWIPIIAKHKETFYKVDPAGRETITREKRGTYLRSSFGSIIFKSSIFENGQEQADRAQTLFTDAKTGNVIEISYRTRVAILRQRLKLPLEPRKLDPATFVGEQVVNGLHCVGRKVTCDDPHLGTSVECGRTWYSPEYDLIVKIETQETMPNKQKIGHIMERYDIQIGTEPDSSAFGIPSGFKFIPTLTPPVSSGCATCKK